MFHRSRYRTAAFGLSAASVVLLTGCLPDVSMSPSVATSTSSSASGSGGSPAATQQPVAAPRSQEPVRPVGDLDTGSVTHVLPAGDRTVVVDYWTTDAATEWTATDTKTVQVSAHLEGGIAEEAAEEVEVLVTRFVATADDGTERRTVAEDRGEFAIAPPFSYGTVLSVQPSAGEADELTLYIQLDLLVETEPGSGRYFRQTVLDSLVLPLVKEDRK